MATHALVVSCSAEESDKEIDEAQLLAETEELLGSLDPIAFLDASDTQSSSSTSVSASTPCSSDSSSTSRRRKRTTKPGNPSRERLQSELTLLRKQVLVLENDLQNMLERQAAASFAENKVLVAPMWERIAKRQLVACERSATKNKRLKTMIKLQKEMVVGMEEALYNWQHVTTPSEPALLDVLAPFIPHKNLSLKPGDDLLFAMLVSELDATYLKVDEAFHEAGLDRTGLEPHMRTTPKTLVTIDGRRRSLFELVEVELSPFDFETENRAAKICSKKASQSPNRVTFLGGWESDNVVTEKHLLKRIYNGAEISFHMLLAIKELEFEDRLVCVWRCMFRCDDHFPGSYVQEMGWYVSTNIETPNAISNFGSQASPVGSLSRMCVYLEPKRFTGPTVSISAEADTMTNLVQNSYYDDLQEVSDMLNNLLMDGSPKQKTEESRAGVAP
ncbi:hypothetical protein Gpo141_00001965 [Globisporangium polare]